jgi:hypothetical protein
MGVLGDDGARSDVHSALRDWSEEVAAEVAWRHPRGVTASKSSDLIRVVRVRFGIRLVADMLVQEANTSASQVPHPQINAKS